MNVVRAKIFEWAEEKPINFFVNGFNAEFAKHDLLLSYFRLCSHVLYGELCCSFAVTLHTTRWVKCALFPCYVVGHIYIVKLGNFFSRIDFFFVFRSVAVYLRCKPFFALTLLPPFPSVKKTRKEKLRNNKRKCRKMGCKNTCLTFKFCL